jgi:Na+-driven multidrug efflux pump
MIGLTLVLTSHHWITLFTTDSATYLVAKQYIEIVGLCFTFQGLGLSLYLASQGANAMKWPVIATILRFVVAIVGGWVAVNYLSSGLSGVFYSSAVAMILFGLMIAVSLKMGAWRKH